MEKLSVCPQTLYKFNSSNELLLETYAIVEKLKWENNSRSINTMGRLPGPIGKKQNIITRNPDFANLHAWFNSCLNQVRLELNYVCEKISVSSSWVNRTATGEWFHRHMHNNSILSGVYYLTEGNARTVFGVDNIWNYDKFTKGLIKLSYENEDTMSILHKHRGTPGELIIFPSVLQHAVEIHRDSGIRYSISFNSFLNGSVGYDEYLSGVKINLE